ncbi:MarR family transcriptional regulator [Arthrobacter dokdonensis]|uniref:MarR family transcriptional regulator n=1 Tax=Arthrobacter dokdonellae TaxID=2211210 RepID=UPI001494A4A7|nr:MarR family transcriptional regulator [Arthrobacter dokdonellae]
MTITALRDTAYMEHDPVRAVARNLCGLIANGQAFRSVRGRELQLGPSDLDALDLLYNDGSMAPKDLSALMGVTSGTMTALLDRVEKAGFLKRERNPNDRRALLIHLTPAGDHAMQWLYEQFDTAVRDSLARVFGLDVAELEKAVSELSKSLELDPEEATPGSRGQPLTHKV